jgi:TIR domain
LGDIDVSSPGDRKLKVFISYSRKDEDFAQDLLAGLQIAGFEPYLDKHDIAAGEDWEARLGRLIEWADTRRLHDFARRRCLRALRLGGRSNCYPQEAATSHRLAARRRGTGAAAA